MNVLITGGSGFIGCHLARYHADEGDRVVVLDNHFKSGGRTDKEFDHLASRANVTAVEADLTRPLGDLRVTGPWDVVYHLAAINGTRYFYEIPYEVARTNVLVTLNLLDWLVSQPCGRLLYASSSEVYSAGAAFGLLRIPTDETAPVVFPQPTPVRFSYGTSKFMGEVLCSHFGEKYRIPVTTVRFHNIYGPRMGKAHVIPEFILRVRRGENPFRVYGGAETRAFCFVSDAVRATAAAAKAPACVNEVVHVGNSDEEIAIEVLAGLIMKQMGREVPVVEAGRRQDSVIRRCPDTGKLLRLTGFRAEVPLTEGIRRTVEWYLAQPDEQDLAKGLGGESPA